ncbi:MAG: cytochrome c biogenesis protein CcsA, partial [Vibrio sp.]
MLDDFSVQYVAMHSNTHLAPWFKIAAVWGGHEGSFLFWLFALSFWTGLVAKRAHLYPDKFGLHVLNTLGLLILAFSIFILYTSNPFSRLFPAPIEGRDLNPMLQDIALIFHPPLLYIGYVGTAVGFAFAIAALLSKKPQWHWATWLRPWVLMAWGFLTLGIMLGSWWAYYELGWGGFWFWDPVENASLMP